METASFRLRKDPMRFLPLAVIGSFPLYGQIFRRNLKGVFTMLLLSRVCAEFRDRTGAVIYRVTPQTRLTFQEAPEAIREDPLFRMLLQDGSVEAGVTPVRQKELEADPLQGTDAEGRTRPAEKPRTGPEDAPAPKKKTPAAKSPAQNN